MTLQLLKDLPLEVPDEIVDLAKIFFDGVSKYWAPLHEEVRAIAEHVAPGSVAQHDAWMRANINTHSKELPLMNPFDVFMFAMLYLLVLLVLRILMSVLPSAKETLPMKAFQLWHNFFLMALSFYMMVEIIRQAIINGYSVWFNNLDNSAAGWPMAKILWIFYVSKIYEFMDTFIMMLRHSFRQVTFLHVYHHCSVFPIWWCVIFLGPTGDSYWSAALNSWVHVVMYSYYFLATSDKIGQRLKRWKSYITICQMTQFALNLVQAVALVYVSMPGYPIRLAHILLVYMITLLMLFYNFYRSMQKAGGKQKRQ
uniref:Elongation of fatty acids protein n=1 Tax=Eutreptiella gymnastica TaxID=73025 RepID=A0A7S1N5I4_9EUGL|mmetsp:Transcript_12294/g.22312  ORF Transcript_12294/g.22312 Transcript_12294/m.22312 type:complete len:311 (+) Transcript_12294:135-1067(+)